MTENKKFCPNCGTPSTIEAAFCLSCGSKFPAFTPQGFTDAPPQQQAIPQMPQAPSGDFITLSCPSCGGKLNITPDTERFACQFCGHEHIVRRSGGLVSLEPVVQVMKSIDSNINLVGVGVNKLGFSSEKQVAEQSITRLKSEMAEINKAIGEIENGSGVGAAIITIMGVGFFALLVIAIANGWSFWLILLFLGFVGLMVWAGISAIKPDPRVKALKEDLARKLAELERNYEIVRRD